MVFGGGASGRWLSHKGEALINGISALIKGTPEGSLVLILPIEDNMYSATQNKVHTEPDQAGTLL